MPIPEPQPTPATDRPFVVNHGTPFWQVAVLAIAMLGGSGLQSWWNRPATVQPAPAVVSQPVQVRTPAIDPVRTLATKDDIGLSDADKDAAIKFASIGDGRYVLYSTPEGSKVILKQIIVSTISDNVKPIDHRPVDPQPDVKPVDPDVNVKKMAIYFYEKDKSSVPAYVNAGLNALNRKGVESFLHEMDATGKDGQILPRFSEAHARAVKEGIPVLIITANGVVTKVIKAPKSLEEITGAVQ